MAGSDLGAEGSPAADAGADPETGPDAATESDVSAAPSDPDPTGEQPLADDPTTVQPTTAVGSGGSGGAGWDGPPAAPWDVPPSPVPGAGAVAPALADDRRARDHRRRHGHLVGPGVFGVLLIWTGIAWLTGVGLTTGLAVGLVILGLGFVLGSFVGGSRWLVVPAILVAIALFLAAVVDIPLSGPVGQHRWSPDSRAELEDEYEVSMGEGTLDLSGVGLLRVGAEVRATVGMGHLVVLVPDDQAVTVQTEVGAGDVIVFGEEQNGIGFDTHERYDGEGGALLLDLEVGLGQIEVRRVARSGDAEAEEPIDAPDPTDSPEPTTPSTLG
jgi:hypothetical protein